MLSTISLSYSLWIRIRILKSVLILQHQVHIWFTWLKGLQTDQTQSFMHTMRSSIYFPYRVRFSSNKCTKPVKLQLHWKPILLVSSMEQGFYKIRIIIMTECTKLAWHTSCFSCSLQKQSVYLANTGNEQNISV